jgi:PAS domain S-box-containing protein
MLLLTVSLLLQVMAAILAFRLATTTGRWKAWLPVAAAITLIAIRRCFLLAQGLANGGSLAPTASDVIALCISALLLVGLAGLSPLFGPARAAEKRARASEGRYRQIAETMLDGVWIVDAEGVTTYVNRQMAVMLGYEPEEMIGHQMYDFMDEAVRAQGEANMARRQRGIGERHDFELRHRDGRRIWTQMASAPLPDPDGGYSGALAVVSDLTGTREIAQALRASESRYRDLMEITRTGFAMLDRDGRVLEANLEYVHLAGYSSLESIRGRPVTDWTAPYDLERNANEVRKTTESGSVFGLEIDYVWPDGTIVPVEINAVVSASGPIMALCRDISTRRNSARALRESEERYALAVEGTNAGIWDWNVATGVAFFSPRWKALLGYQHHELANQVSTWEALLHPDDRTRTLEAIGRHLEERVPFLVEYRMRARDGGWRWFVAHGQARWDPEGKPIRMAGSAIDITAQKQAEGALRDMEERFRQFADHSAEVLWFRQLKGDRVLYVSPSFERVWGRSMQALYADADIWLQAIHPDDRPQVNESWARLCESPDTSRYDVEYRIVQPTGGVRWIHDRATLLRDEAGLPAQVCGIAGDITDRKRSEATERETGERIRALIDASPLPIVALSAEGMVTGWNPAAERVFGYAEAEVIGLPPPIVDQEEEAETHDFRRKLFEGRAFHSRPARRRHKDGSLLDVTISTAPTRDGDGRVTGLVAIYEDVTERRRVEVVSRQLHERLLEAQKLESLGVLAGGIAHDFNNLLTMILGNLHFARGETTAVADHALEEIEQATMRAAELTAQMLAYAGKGQLTLRPIELSMLIRESAALLQSALPPDARLALELDDSLPPIDADPALLRQIIVNLTTNAGESLPEGQGVVSIRTGTMEADRTYLAATVLPESVREGRYAFVEVADQGKGIPAEVQQRMFEPFYSTQFQGRGLGLAAVMGIVRSHRGTLRVESQAGRGTTVRVLLPAPGSGRLAPASGTPSATPRAGVLLVDDEESLLRVMRRFLERAGFSVYTATTGREALQRFADAKRQIRAIVLDLILPDMGGEQALAALRAMDGDTPVILTSGHGEEEIVRRAAGQRLAALLAKPYLPAELLDVLEQVITADRSHPAESPARE